MGWFSEPNLYSSEISYAEYRGSQKRQPQSPNIKPSFKFIEEVATMALIRWEPFREINTLQREMNRLFDDFMVPTTRENGFSFAPAAEIEETPEAVHLKLELPGMEAKDLDVQVTADSVSISGERKTESRTEEKGVVRSEFRYGKFQRIIPLPVRINNQNVNAEYKDGILTLTLPKVEEEKQKVVKVNLQ
jgi:HSP20 family protein